MCFAMSSPGAPEMRYWPLSVIAQSPLVPSAFVAELRDFCLKMPSQGAFYAAMAVAGHTEPVEAPNLVVIQSIGAPNRRAYVDYPELDEWLNLERATVMENNGYAFVLMDALH